MATMTMPVQTVTIQQIQPQPINYQLQLQPQAQPQLSAQPVLQSQPAPPSHITGLQSVQPSTQPLLSNAQQQQYAQQVAAQQPITQISLPPQQSLSPQQLQYTSPQSQLELPQVQQNISPQPILQQPQSTTQTQQYNQQIPPQLQQPAHTVAPHQVLGVVAPSSSTTGMIPSGAHVRREKSVALKEWTSSVEKNIDAFEDCSKVIVNKHQKSHIKTSGFSESLKQISSAETCSALQHALLVLSNNIAESEKHRLILLGQLQAHVVERFKKYESKIQVQKHNIKSRNVAYNKLLNKLHDYNTLKQAHKSETKIQHSKELLEAEIKRMNSNEYTLNTSVKQFEQQRIEEMKSILKRYVQGQIYFMSRSIEGLSTAYGAICNINSEHEADALIKQLQLCEYNGQTA